MNVMRRAADAAIERPTLAWAIGVVVAIPSVIGGFAALGIDIVPWSGKADRAEVVSQRAADRAEVLRLDARIVELERELWTDKLEKANDELSANPNSRAAMRDKIEADQKLRQILRLRRSQP